MNLCEVCSLPAERSPCSQRCGSLRPQKSRVDELSLSIEHAILDAVAALRKGSTECPGNLATKVLSQFEFGALAERDALALLRSRYRHLRDRGDLRFFQKGVCVPVSKWPKGAFRIGK